MKLLLVALLAGVAVAQGPVRFDHFQVYRVVPRSDPQVAALRQLQDAGRGFDFWTEVTGANRSVDVMVPPHLKYDFLDALALQRLDAQLWIEDVQRLVDAELPPAAARNARDHDWTRYQTLDELNEWLDSLVEKYPVVTPIVGGKSYEGREIRGVKVSFGPGRKGVFIEGGIHAREWIAPATVTYILHQLLTSKDPDVRRVAESRDWHVFPSINPDGYAYTFTNNRMWRKTRKPYGSCVGADPNRNWGYHWMHGGASSYPCSETHAGSAAFSEVETKSLSEYISGVADTLDTYLAFHSYSQLFLIPFGHAGLEVPDNNDELLRIGHAAADSLAQRYGTRYVVGNIPQTIYVASGGSMDWAVGVHRNIRIAYTYELRDTGRYGFLLPPNQIIPTGEETLDSVVTIITEADASK